MVHWVRLRRRRHAGAWRWMRGNATIPLHLDQADTSEADNHSTPREPGKHTTTLLPSTERRFGTACQRGSRRRGTPCRARPTGELPW